MTAADSQAARPWTVEALLATLAAMDSAGGAGKAGVLLLGRYAVSGRQAREVEGCVEVDGHDTEGDAVRATVTFYLCPRAVQVTVTFYPCTRAFAAAQQRYASFTHRMQLRRKLSFVPNEDGAAASAAGEPLPPFLVTPQYTSLTQWAAAEGAHATSVATAQKLEGYVRAVAQLHEIGEAHGALQPHSVVHGPDLLGWAFRSLDHAIKLGTVRKIRPDLKYTPPEDVHAAGCGTEAVPSTAAADIWAIGVLSYELFTRQPAFPGAAPCAFDPPPATAAARENGAANGGCALPEHLREDMRGRLLGREPLPWEPGSPGAEARLACMGRFRDSVLLCLSRGPQQRPSAEGLLKQWRDAYLSNYSVR